MGDVADMMLDGTCCADCGCFIDDRSDGYPRFCGPCGLARDEKLGLTDSTDVVDFEAERIARAARAARAARGTKRRHRADHEFDEACQLAEANGLRLHRCSFAHYQLIHVAKNWLLDIYPGNRRLYSDPKRKGPFLSVPHDWTLIEVVRVAIKRERRLEVKR